jgi:type IV pilus assembly protein PilO
VLSTPTSRWTAGAAAVGLGLVAVSYVAVIGPKRGEAADLTDETAAAQQQNDSLQIRTAQLKAQFATLPQRRAELSTMIGQIPVTADVPHFVRSLDALASGAGVTLDTVTPSAAQVLGASTATPAGAGSGTTGTGTGTAAGTTTPSGAGTAGTATGGDATPADSGSGQVIEVPVSVSVHGPYFKAVTFLKGLQSGQRAFLVSGLQVAVSGADVTLTVRGRIFVVPGAAQALAAAATTSAPAPAGAPGSAVPVPSPSR